MDEVVDLVRNEQHRSPGSCDQATHRLVVTGHPNGGVNHEQDDVSILEGLLGLRRHLVIELVAGGHPSARVDQIEGNAGPLRLDKLSITSHSGVLLDHRHPAADDPIQQ